MGYSDDGDDRVNWLGHDLAGSGADQRLDFLYNTASQMATRTSDNIAYASTSAVNVTRSYAANGLNQYTASGPNALSYDANGNLTGDGTTSYVYDAENRLVSASGGRVAALSYDPLGRLWQVSAPSGTTRFVYDGDRLVQEYDGAGTLLRFYRHGPGTDEPIMWYEWVPGVAWDRRFLHADHQGSIVAVADSLANPVYVHAYDAWGIPNAYDSWDRAAVATRGRFGYTGQTWIPELGLWYYKARVYSPTLGRFLQTDPLGYEDQVNLYAYVDNDPVDHSDPSGERITVTGDREERAVLRAAVLHVARSSPELRARYLSLRDSKYVHDLRASHGEASGNKSLIRVNSENGVGTSTRSIIETGGTQDKHGFKFDINVIVGHELFSHAYDADKGRVDRSIDPQTDIRRSEERAVRTENIYRRAEGLPQRTTYGGKKVKEDHE